MSGLSGLVLGLAKARQGYNQGEAQGQQIQSEQAAQQQQLRMKMLQMQMEEDAKKQQQANADRTFGLESNKFDFEKSKPLPVHNIDPLSPQGQQAELTKAEAIARINAKYRENPVANAIAVKQWERSHPDPTAAGGSASSKPPTEAQAKAASYLGIAAPELPAIDQMENNLPNKYLSKLPVIGNIVIGKKNPEFQAEQAAGDRFVNQYLRFQSGAAISESEFDAARKQFIPQPGDTPAVIQAKHLARQRVIDGLRAGAGAAAPSIAPASPQPSVAPLTSAQKARAATDPAYRAFLASKGHKL